MTEPPIRSREPDPVPPPEDVDVLRLEEAAYLMRNSARSVRRLIAAGRLRALSVTPGGTGLRVRREEVERYLRGAEFVERPMPKDDPEPSPRAPGFRVKADWASDVDPFAPRRKKPPSG